MIAPGDERLRPSNGALDAGSDGAPGGADDRRSGRAWPYWIAGMLAAHATFLILVAIYTSRDRSFAVEPDYYAKAVSWDASRALERASAELGWSVRSTVGAPSGLFGDRPLRIELENRAGEPVHGARVSVDTFHHARGRERLSVDLPETVPGRYERTLPMRRAGLWEIRLVAERGEASFRHTEVVEVGSESPRGAVR